MSKKFSAYTLIEMLVVIAIISVVAIFILPVSINELQKSRLDSTVGDIASELYQFQQNAYARRNNKSYGVAFNQPQQKYTFFIGNSLASAEETSEKILDSKINITQINLSGGATEIVFNAGSFKPSAFGNVFFNDGINSFRLVINSEGLIDYY